MKFPKLREKVTEICLRIWYQLIFVKFPKKCEIERKNGKFSEENQRTVFINANEKWLYRRQLESELLKLNFENIEWNPRKIYFILSFVLWNASRLFKFETI